MRRISAAVVAALWLGISAASAGPDPTPQKDWVLAYVEKSAGETGRLGWDGFGVGTWVQYRMTQEGGGMPPGGLSQETKETLTARDEKGTTTILRQARKVGGGDWSAGSGATLARGPIAGGKVASEDLGSETIEVAGRKMDCAKQRWTCSVGEKVVRTHTVWKDPAGVPLRWVNDDGDGWLVTYEVLRVGVAQRVGDVSLDGREIRKTAKGVSPGTRNVEFTGTELWSASVPDFVVRAETTQSTKTGDSTTTSKQVRELVAFKVQ